MNAIASEKMPETVSAGAAPSAVNSQKNNSIAPVPPDPVFVLAPRSFSSIVATMLGQHPQMYGVPELELFAAETMGEWWELCTGATFPRAECVARGTAKPRRAVELTGRRAGISSESARGRAAIWL